MKKSKISLKKSKLRDRQKLKLKERVERTIKRKDTDFFLGGTESKKKEMRVVRGKIIERQRAMKGIENN